MDKIIFRIRFKFLNYYKFFFYKTYWLILGMKIGSKTNLKKLNVTWPHQVSIGSYCTLENGIVFKFDGIWQKGPLIKIADNVFIGKDCEFNINCGITIKSHSNISSGCKFIDHNHGIKLGSLIGIQPPKKKEILIEEDVWLGVNVIVLNGVVIGKGAVIGAASVVTKSIPTNEIWAGIPAKKINYRTDKL